MRLETAAEGGSMKKGSIGKFAVLALFVLVLLCSARAQSSPQGSQDENNSQPKESEKPVKKRETTKLHVVVTAGEDPKPIAAAQVDVTSKEEGVNFSTSARTDSDGGVDLTVPRGKVLIQVIAQHWNSGGVLRNLKGEKETVEIKLR
jgi:hypothetical protein